MALVKSTSFAGVPVENCRPQASTSMLDDMEIVAAEQAMAYEAITGLAIPGGSLTVTPHTHNGNAGSVIPIPLVTQWVDANLLQSIPAASIGGDGYGTWAAPMQYVPTGMQTVRVVIHCDHAVGARMRISHYATTSVTLQGRHVLTNDGPSILPGLFVFYADITTVQGDINVWFLEAFEFSEWTGHALHELPASVICYSVLPLVGAPLRETAYNDSAVPYDEVTLPATTRHIGAHAFAPFDSAMFNVIRGVSSYLALGMNMNDSLLFELATGRPAVGNTTRAYDGHTHGGATTLTGSCGAEIHQPLMAHSFGACRDTAAGVATRNNFQMGASSTRFTGRIHALELLNAAGTTVRTIGYFPFRMPAAPAASLTTTGKLKVAALSWAEPSKPGNMSSLSLRFQAQNSTGAAGGTLRTLTHSGDGFEINAASLDYHGSSAVSDDGEDAQLLVQMQAGSASAGRDNAFLSFCLYMA